MLSIECEFPFVVMVAVLGYVNSQSNNSPICKPPATRCSVFKRSVCEWSDSGEPVWACRGFLESVNNGRPKPSFEVSNAVQQDSEPDVILGEYEYRLPQGKSSVVSQQDSSETDVKYITFTYPIITKTKKNGASLVDFNSDVKVGKQTSSVASSGKSISVSKTESGSEVRIGTDSLPVGGSRSGEVGESISNVKLETYSNWSPLAMNSSVSKVEKDSNVETGTYTLATSSGKSNNVAHESATINSSGSKGKSESDLNIATYTIPGFAVKTDGAAHIESDSDVKTGTITYQIPLKNTISTSREESVSGSGKGEASLAGSESNALLGTYKYLVSSNERIASSQKEYHSNAPSATDVNTISSQNTSAIGYSNSGATVQTGTLFPSESTTSHIDSKAEVQFGTYQGASDNNLVATQDDQTVRTGLDTRVSARVEMGTASNVYRESPQTNFVPFTETPAIQTQSSSQDRIASKTHDVPSTGNTILESVASTNPQLDLHLISSSSNSDFNSDTESVDSVHSVGSDKNHGERAHNNEASVAQRSLQLSSLMGDASSLRASIPANNYPNAFGTQQYNSWINNYAGPVAAGTNGVTGNSQYVRGELSLGRESIDSPLSHNYHNSASNGNTAGHYQQYQSNSPAGSGSAPQNYGSAAQNKFSFSYPHYGYSGYQSLEQNPSASSLQTASSGSGLYHWPRSWTPLVNLGLGAGGYGGNWYVEQKIPLVNLAGLNTILASQSKVPLANSDFYAASRSLSSGSTNSATSTSTSSNSNPWLFAWPSSQYASAQARGNPEIGSNPCSFCKKLMLTFGGAAICDFLEPIILEFFSKVLEIFRKRLK